MRRSVFIVFTLSFITLSIPAVFAYDPKPELKLSDSYYYIDHEYESLCFKAVIEIQTKTDLKLQVTLISTEVQEPETGSLYSELMQITQFLEPIQFLQKDQVLSLVWKIETTGSMILPSGYELVFEEITLNLKQKIMADAAWEGQEGALRLRDPYISNFIAYDTSKGTGSVFRTYITNPGFESAYISKIKYQVSSTTYPFTIWTPYYNFGGLVPARQTRIFEKRVGPLVSSSSGRFGLNVGDFSVLTVRCLETADWTTDEDFTVTLGSGNHYMFAAIVYDSEFNGFLNEHSKSLSDYIDQVQNNPIDKHRRSDGQYWSYSNGMEDIDDLQILYSAISYEWWDDNGNSSAVPSNDDVYDAGQIFLDSSNDWNYQGG
jgi:hypothetical protein